MPIRSISAALLILFLMGCTHSLSTKELPPPAGTLYDYHIESSGGAPYSLNELANAVANADVVLVGEWHTHPGVHLFQTQLLATLASRHPATVLSMEQFTRADQAIINSYLAGDFGENSLLSKTSKWSNYEGSYRPLVEYAKAQSLPVIASNAPIEIVRCIGREGKAYLDRLPQDKRGLVAETLTDGESPYKAKFFAAMFHGDEEKTANQYLAQLAWDDTMAESIVNYLADNPGDKVIHIAGAFHVEDGLGIASRIAKRNPALNIAIISPQTEDAPLADTIKDFRLVVNPLPKQWLSEEEMSQALSSMRHSTGTSLTCP
ncbi:ChaN family lipoprotein [Grimontia sp. NTOU-MAR1]|uniref:ChaN family lipoprotein n=1 Tax=Grimontia sp. NTOU-MAR1 TaxID=3111011 RepID=UPI002DBDE422|nr:ChaN family lipoprotein [Grimontia sp. NTOU-MAR1]WRV99092.1 ChaN family lipoprotein [Grimontia sp. NTOU-MAR1]